MACRDSRAMASKVKLRLTWDESASLRELGGNFQPVVVVVVVARTVDAQWAYFQLLMKFSLRAMKFTI
eukprot:1666021-Amphidinium_carterae.1